MQEYTMRALIDVKGLSETSYLQQIDRLAVALKEDRDTVAAFLEGHPEMEEFLSGDIENGYTYVPERVTVAPEELLKSMEPGLNGRICTPIEVVHGS